MLTRTVCAVLWKGIYIYIGINEIDSKYLSEAVGISSVVNDPDRGDPSTRTCEYSHQRPIWPYAAKPKNAPCCCACFEDCSQHRGGDGGAGAFDGTFSLINSDFALSKRQQLRQHHVPCSKQMMLAREKHAFDIVKSGHLTGVPEVVGQLRQFDAARCHWSQESFSIKGDTTNCCLRAFKICRSVDIKQRRFFRQ